ncbi:MAG TPA: DegV family protein [Deinococcales bacterium]|nr:DegV family protein [Deinococcales bacterium]
MATALITDSTCDLPLERAEALRATVVPLYVTVGSKSYRDVYEISTDEVYAQAKAQNVIPSTSQPTPADFQASFEGALQGGADRVLAVVLSGVLSGTVKSALLAANAFPGRVTVFDSGVATGGLGLMVERASRLLAEGATAADVVGTLERIKPRSSTRFTVATLDYLIKNGRIGAARGFFASLLGIHPMLVLENERMEAAGRPRGARRALEQSIEDVKAYVQRTGSARAMFMYTGRREQVEPLRDACLKLGVREAGTFQAGTTIACHVGPDTYGLCLEPVDA